jgi:hypothetical protein
MELPERLNHLVSDLGDSLVKAMAEDDHCRDLAFQIQAKGYGLVLIIEAAPVRLRAESTEGTEDGDSEAPFSEDDKSLMKSFKIRMD